MVLLDIITGFLGAGKTTLIKQLIREGFFGNEKVVIIENDYGEVNIDAAILSSDGVPVYEITKGCICCSLQGDFISTLNTIYDTLKPDRVLIEPSGIFMLETIFELIKAPDLCNLYEINTITTVLDGSLVDGSFLPMEGFIGNQLKYADHILVSKLDDSNKDQWHIRNSFIKGYNPTSPIYKWTTTIPLSTHNNLFKKNHSKDKSLQSPMKHPENISSMTITPNTTMSLSQFKAFVTSVQSGVFGDIIRMKGLINLDDKTYECHYTPTSFECQEVNLPSNNALIIIGNLTKRTQLEQAFI